MQQAINGLPYEEQSCEGREIPRFIAVEGPIGVGKTTLAKRLAETFNYETLLEEPEENPFLERFYQDRRASALPTQLFFLFQRSRQIQNLRQADMFQQVRVADFLIEKDPIFARITLDDDEFQLYQNVYSQLTIDSPKPDLVVYLQSPVEVLLERIHRRGIHFERFIDSGYLRELNEAYTQFFYYYDESPLLIVNASEVDFVNSDKDYQALVDYMLTVKRGKNYYNPQPF